MDSIEQISEYRFLNESPKKWLAFGIACMLFLRAWKGVLDLMD